MEVRGKLTAGIMVHVIVKWQKETFKDVEVDTSQPALVFKGQLFALTGVAPERQKIMVKGGLLQDDHDWNKLGLKEGQRLMMMGSAEAVPEAPKDAPVFLEDLPEEDQEAATNADYTAGLVNLGNTCYMNSTVQCLRSVPELRSALSDYSAAAGPALDASHKLTLATRDLFRELGTSKHPVAPHRFLKLLREKYPQFGELGEHGTPMQQDAEECWTQLVYTLSQRLHSEPSAAVVKELFGIDLASRLTCAESGEESTETETTFTMKCHITADVNQLPEGLQHGLKGELEKVSPALGRSAVWMKESRISRLPQYLTVQFVRFFWKRESRQKAKILRKVAFPMRLDVYDFCTPELQGALAKPREALREKEEAAAGLAKASDGKGQASGAAVAGAAAGSGGGGNGAPNGDGSGSGAKAEGAQKMDVDGGTAPPSEGADAAGGGVGSTGGGSVAAAGTSASAQASGSRSTGVYELAALLTHKGRSADSGHYVAWVKQENGTWIEFDDDNPIMRKEDEITSLAGGGDWHMAYILVYRSRLA